MNGRFTQMCGGGLLALTLVLAGCIAEQDEVDEEVDRAPSALIVAVAPATGGVGLGKVDQPSSGTDPGANSAGVKVPTPDTGEKKDPDPNPWVPGMSGPEDQASSSQQKH